MIREKMLLTVNIKEDFDVIVEVEIDIEFIINYIENHKNCNVLLIEKKEKVLIKKLSNYKGVVRV